MLDLNVGSMHADPLGHVGALKGLVVYLICSWKSKRSSLCPRGLVELGMAVGCVRAACAAFWGACCPIGQARPRAPSQQELLEVPASPGATGSQAAVVSPLDPPSVLITSSHDRSSRWCGGHGPSLCSWLHIGHKAKAETRIDEQEFLMKGWLYRECHSTVEAASMLQLRLRRRWFVLTPHGLDYYREPASTSGKGRRLGGLVLTRLCTAEGPDEESQEAAGTCT
uniref:unconventional myosin-X-like isoform X2 n=1 Tax=Myxine glutinosa TaxID=7769 RepID=UPI00358DFB33